jgi:hypothetical protein
MQDLRPNFNFALFHRGEVVRAGANASGELLPRHIKAARLPDAATLLIASSLRADRTLGLTSSLLFAIPNPTLRSNRSEGQQEHL